MVRSTYGGTLKTYKNNTRGEFVVQIKYLSVVSRASIRQSSSRSSFPFGHEKPIHHAITNTTFPTVLLLLKSHLSLTTPIIIIIVGSPLLGPSLLLQVFNGLTIHLTVRSIPPLLLSRPIYPTPSSQPSDLGMAP